MEPEAYLYGGLVIGGIFLLCALFGSTRPLPGVFAAGLAFLLTLWFWMNAGSLDMGMAVFILGSLIVIPAIAFAITLLICRKNTATPVSGKSRWIAALAGLLFCIGGYWASIYFADDAVDARADAGIRAAVLDADGKDLNYWRHYRTNYPRSFPLEMILEVHGLSEKAFILLSSQEKIWKNTYLAILQYPKTPERQELLRKLAATGRSIIDEDVFIPLMDSGDTETVDILYHCFVPDLDSEMIDKNRLDLLQEILRRGPTQTKRDIFDYTPPHALRAAAANSPEYAQVLLDAGQKPDTADLARACIVNSKNKGTAELLLAAGANPNGDVDGLTPLQCAVAGGSPELVDALLAAGANGAVTDWQSRTVLHIAAMFSNAHAATKLLEQGASPSAADKQGLTPLHWAAWIGDPDMAALLLQAEASADTPDSRGWTPLFYAAYQGHAPVLAVLLRDAPGVASLVDMKDYRGRTVLDLAANPGAYDSHWYEYLREVRDLGIPLKAVGGPRGGVEPHPGLWLHSLNRRAQTVALLLAAGADATRVNDASSILHQAFGTSSRFSGIPLSVSQDKRPDEHLVEQYVALDALPLYVQALEALFQAGAALPDDRDIDFYCANSGFGYTLDVSGVCRTMMKKELAQRRGKAEE